MPFLSVVPILAISTKEVPWFTEVATPVRIVPVAPGLSKLVPECHCDFSHWWLQLLEEDVTPRAGSLGPDQNSPRMLLMMIVAVVFGHCDTLPVERLQHTDPSSVVGATWVETGPTIVDSPAPLQLFSVPPWYSQVVLVALCCRTDSMTPRASLVD